ncbi:MAG: 50S ribosomal protein L21 [Candidatus Cloacimonetes bacterium]|nr:50S ribosomal protein L21 [Candidatus Cloacimonadota bacterium]
MYAIVEFRGTQLKVENNAVVKVPYLAELKQGEKIEILEVLMIRTENDIIVGTPVVANAKVIAEVISDPEDLKYREKKIIVFKKKRRKGYRVKKGHKQKYSLLRIETITN